MIIIILLLLLLRTHFKSATRIDICKVLASNYLLVRQESLQFQLKYLYIFSIFESTRLKSTVKKLVKKA